MPQDTAQELLGSLAARLVFPVPAYLVYRLSVLIGGETIEFSDTDMHRPDAATRPVGRLIVYTARRVLVQDVADADDNRSHLTLEVVPRLDLRRLTSSGLVDMRPRQDFAATSYEWPWEAQLQAHYESLSAPLALPLTPGYRQTVEPFRAFLPKLVADLSPAAALVDLSTTLRPAPASPMSAPPVEPTSHPW
jgi:hypothetical protein